MEARMQEGGDAPATPMPISALPAGLLALTVRRQAISPAKRLLPGTAVQTAQLRPDAVGADQHQAAGARPCRRRFDRGGDAVGMQAGDSRTVGAGDELDAGLAARHGRAARFAGRRGEREVGRPPALLGCCAERHAAKFGQAGGVAQR